VARCQRYGSGVALVVDVEPGKSQLVQLAVDGVVVGRLAHLVLLVVAAGLPHPAASPGR
jgi:hypothetical protein